jgi:6-pyruvoyltetrahydropterin/6-carboxytetrahydropterin synthase
MSERMQAVITRRYRFSASHRLHSPALSDAENRAVYGKCNNPYGHGHDYVLEVSVRGMIEPETGLVAPLPELDELVNTQVVRAMDHRNLNEEVPEFAGTPLAPTTENLAAVVRARLLRAWTQEGKGSEWKRRARLEKIRIYETPRNIIEAKN